MAEATTPRPFGDHASEYVDAGWTGVVPLGTRAKKSPPKGYTGATGAYATATDIESWRQEHPAGNIGLRMAPGVIGIDVDAYDGKVGWETWTDMCDRLGAPPKTWVSTSRTDGKSGIRFYRLDHHTRLIGAIPGIEIIQQHHRYAVVWPSIHPDHGGTYNWITPDGEINVGVPHVDDLPVLPAAWLEELEEANKTTRERHRMAGGTDTHPAVDKQLGALARNLHVGSRHDAGLRVVTALTRLASLDYPGADRAIDDARHMWFASIGDSRGQREAEAEWQRMIDSAGKEVAGSSAQIPRWEPPGAERIGFDDIFARASSSDAPGDPDEISDVLLERLPSPIVWSDAFWDGDDGEDWLIAPVIPSQRHTVLFAPAKMGKSLLALEVAAAAATGRSVLGQDACDPVRVVYLDFEMTESDVRERLMDMGYGPEDDLEPLAYFPLPSLPLLDTPEGGALVELLALRHRAQLVVIDTMARVVGGEENSADTYRMFDLHTSVRLKRAGIAVLRLDHAGKDLEKGQRGSSEKAGYADLVWSLVANEASGQVTLRATHRRIGWAPQTVKMRRDVDPVLRHVLSDDEPLETGVIELVRLLDEWGVDPDLSRRKVGDILRARGEKVRTKRLVQAMRIRRHEAAVAALGAVDNFGKSEVKTVGNHPGNHSAGTTPKTGREPLGNHTPEMPSDLGGNHLGTTGTTQGVQVVPDVVPPIRGTTRGPGPDTEPEIDPFAPITDAELSEPDNEETT